MLIALLCILTTVLFVPFGASASGAGASEHAHPRAEAVFASEQSGNSPSALAADRAAADSDNPFEDGRLNLADAGTPMPRRDASTPVVTADTGPAGAESPLPERPPRA